MTFTVTPEPEFARIKIFVTSDGYKHVNLYRYYDDPDSPFATMERVRGGSKFSAGGASDVLVWDYEAPLGVTVGYAVVRGNGATIADTPTPPTVPYISTMLETADNAVWLKHPGQSALNIQLCCTVALPDRASEPNVNSQRPLGQARSVAIFDVRSGWTGDLVFATKTKEQAQEVRNLVRDGYPLLLQSSPAWGGVYSYFEIGTVTEQKYVTDPTFEPRRWTFPCKQTEPPYGDVAYSNVPTYEMLPLLFDTYADLAASVPTYLALATEPETYA